MYIKCAMCDNEFDWKKDRGIFSMKEEYDRLNPDHLMCYDCTKKLLDYKAMIKLVKPYNPDIDN